MINKLKKTIKQYQNHRKYIVSYWWYLRQRINSSTGWKKKYYEKKHKKVMQDNIASIPVKCQIGSQPTFPHGLAGIFVSEGAQIGKNCILFQQVTIGSNTLQDSKTFGAPTIGDNAYIGAGAKIIGAVTVGNNVRIGANCVITQDIPDNATVVLKHPRIIVSQEPKDNTFRWWSTKDEK